MLIIVIALWYMYVVALWYYTVVVLILMHKVCCVFVFIIN